MANRYGDIELPLIHKSVVNTTYKYSIPKSPKIHKIQLSWLVSYLNEEEEGREAISIQDFANALNEAVLDNGFLQLMGSQVRVNWLVIEPNANSSLKASPSTQHSLALNGKYGYQPEPVDPLRGFHFTMHQSNSLRPTNFYVRGVPRSLDAWDKEETMHKAVESCCQMLITDLPLGPLSLRQVLPQPNSYRLDFVAPDAVNGHGTRLFSVGKKPQAVQRGARNGKSKVPAKATRQLSQLSKAKKSISR
jgi:hypothetical protein